MEQIRERRWRLKEPDEQVVTALSTGGDLPPVLARLLVNRGIADAGEAGGFLVPSLAGCHDPFLMNGMAGAVERLVRARQLGETVCVYGDYDVDGITATALLIQFFRTVGIRCFFHIPNRMDDGYGLAETGIRTVATAGATVIVTVDCGVTAVSAAHLCATLGMDLIITDHHTPGEVIPTAHAVLNPLLPGCGFPWKQLSGVGVAFNLLMALRSRLRDSGALQGCELPNLREYLDLVALGTVADVVPLKDENRLFVTFGLRELTAARRLGVRALKQVAGITGDVTSFDVGFRLAPRLNACGRLEDATRGVELLLSTDPEEAELIAGELDSSNAERQHIEQEILAEALEQLRHADAKSGIVLASERWHPGVIGIVASRIVELYHRPTILIALKDGSGRGSGRSIPAFHLYEALAACSGRLSTFGGHKYAAGLAVLEEELENFIREFDAQAAGTLTPDDLTPELLIDAQLGPEDITPELADQVARLEPYGAGNPSPLFLLRSVSVAESRVLKDKHLKLRLDLPGGTVDAIAFNRGDTACGPLMDIVFTPEINLWNGRKRLQLKIRDVKPCEQGR